MISVRNILIFTCAVICSGCATVKEHFTNEVTCGAEGKLLYISFYGPIGLSSKVDKSPIACVDQGAKK